MYRSFEKKFPNITLYAVGDGKVLVKKVKYGNYGLIITDNRMPQKTGLAAIKEIRKFNSKIPICLLSGYLDEEDRQELLAQKPSYYVNKSDKMRYQTLEKLIKQYILK